MSSTFRTLIARTALVIAALFLVVVGAGSANARNRPTVNTPYECFNDLSTTKGTIYGTEFSMCCYDDGCYVCYVHQGELFVTCDWVAKAIYGVLPSGLNPAVADPGVNPLPPFGQVAPGIKPPL